MTHLSNEFDDDVHLSVLRCESLIGHVTCSTACANEHITSTAALSARLEANVPHVRMKPAVCLTIHCLWAQSCSYEEYRLTFQRPQHTSIKQSINQSINLLF